MVLEQRRGGIWQNLVHCKRQPLIGGEMSVFLCETGTRVGSPIPQQSRRLLQVWSHSSFPRSALKTVNTVSRTKLCAGIRGKWWEEANIFFRTSGQEGCQGSPWQARVARVTGFAQEPFWSVLAASSFPLAWAGVRASCWGRYRLPPSCPSATVEMKQVAPGFGLLVWGLRSDRPPRFAGWLRDSLAVPTLWWLSSKNRLNFALSGSRRTGHFKPCSAGSLSCSNSFIQSLLAGVSGGLWVTTFSCIALNIFSRQRELFVILCTYVKLPRYFVVSVTWFKKSGVPSIFL